MKVCRMCWALLDGQLNRCDCITGSSEIQFQTVGEAINHFVKHERLMSKRARNLETLVKGKIKKLDAMCEDMYKVEPLADIRDIEDKLELLQSLVKESENTVKELGSEGKK